MFRIWEDSVKLSRGRDLTSIGNGVPGGLCPLFFNSSSLGRRVTGVTENKPYPRPESYKPYSLLTTASTHEHPPSGCRFGTSCFGCNCKLTDSQAYQPGAMAYASSASLSGYSIDQHSGFSSQNSSEMSRIKVVGVYQPYTGSYSRMPGIDIAVVGRDPRHGSIFPMEDHARDWPIWSNQLHHSTELQYQSWMPSFTEEAGENQTDVNTFYGRGRKKRVPYTKQQLKELEREYTISKFITKDKRRQIASCTSLSERQVTIWFQNRRVKDKKFISKMKEDDTWSRFV